MTVEADIAIEALSAIGKATIRSLTEGSPEANACQRHITKAIEAALEDAEPQFARTFRAGTLLDITLPPGSQFFYAYVYPPDCLKMHSIGKTLPTENPIPFQLGRRFDTGDPVVFTTRSAAVLVYTARAPRLTSAPQSWKTAAAWKLAMMIVSELRKGELDWYRKAAVGYQAALSHAATADANTGAPDAVSELIPDWIQAYGITTDSGGSPIF